MRSFFRISVSAILIGVLLVNPILVSAVEELNLSHTVLVGEEREVSLSYSLLMRAAHELKSGESKNTREEVAHAFEQFIREEKESLQNFTISVAKKAQYFELLDTQLHAIKNPPQPSEIAHDEDFSIAIPEKPSLFRFNNEIPEIRSIDLQVLEKKNLISAALKLLGFGAENAYAFDVINLPEIDDVRADSGEVQITPEIRDIAKTLERNPVKILNFVRNTIRYEPYYGAKKGSMGCLIEQVCNDVDSSSLLIAILRAAGIPARYKKSIAVFPVEQLKNLLGVDETRSVYASFALNKVPVYTISGNNGGLDIDAADFLKETRLALEWVFVEAFYDYDERGGNIDNTLSFDGMEYTEEVHMLLYAENTKKQWISMDASVRPYTKTTNEILADTAKFDSQVFWNDYLKYQGTLSPLHKYAQDLLQITGKDLKKPDYQSTKNLLQKEYDIIPPTLPYYATSGQVDGGITIKPETWSILPGGRRNQVKISLLRKDKTTVLTKTFFGSDINNRELNLFYRGATQTDEQIIAKYGGIHATPAALVDIVPYLQNDDVKYQGEAKVKIGETLIVQFEYTIGNQILHTDQKLSVAGNHEGIFIALSKVQTDPSLSSDSAILLKGNAALGRKYLERVEAAGNMLKGSLDYEYNTIFSRAVVTQNRVLAEVNGVPTTFDFKGLTIDASSYINGYSNRGNYKNHSKDFHLLWGLQGSYEEGQLFIDIAGLDAISTVKGLQYAYGNPQNYTVYTITQNNAAVIDQLQLPEIVKMHMKIEVAKGNTVVTPDKLVTKGVFRGVLYIVLRQDGSGLYAIGEQVGNGANSTVQFQVASYRGPVAIQSYQYTVTNNGNRISYQDNREADGLFCKIAEPRHKELVNRQDWKGEYGFPCTEGTLQFGTVSHTYLHAAEAANFSALEGTVNGPIKLYEPYWVKKDIVKQILLNNQDYSFKTFKFNPIAGTYSYHGSGHTAYYQPESKVLNDGTTQENGKGWIVKRALLSKLEERSYKPEFILCEPNDKYCSDIAYKKDFVLAKLGYPKSNQIPVEKRSYPFGTDGFHQEFIGGQLFYETTWIDNIYYVPGYIEKEYARQTCSDEIEGKKQCGLGSEGRYGFPISDPVYNAQDDMIFQDFENGSRIKQFFKRPIGQNIEVVENVQKIAIIRNYTDPKYRDELVEGLMDGFLWIDLYGVGINFAAGLSVPFVVNQFKSHIVKKLGKKAVGKVGLRFVPAIGWIYSGVTFTLAIDANWPIVKACDNDPDKTPLIDGKPPAYYCGLLAVNAAAFGAGTIANIGASNIINKFGVTTYAAKVGKSKVSNAVKKDTQWRDVKQGITENPKIRTTVLENANKLSPQMLDDLLNDVKLRPKFFSSANFSKFTTYIRDLKRYEHIFMGDETSGWHFFKTGRKGSIIKNTVKGPNGVYKADVEIMINGKLSPPKTSTFFPDEWSEDQVLDAINRAHDIIITNKTKAFVEGNTYQAMVNDVNVRLFLTEDNKIISAFPFLN